MRLPNIVCLTGLDGCGKSTHAALLADYLDTRNDLCSTNGPEEKHCLRMKFPKYDTPIGKLIASKLKEQWIAIEQGMLPIESPQTLNAFVLQSLMTVNRLEAVDEIERAVVVEGRSVVLDRYWVDAVAYGGADGLDTKWLEVIHSRMPKAHHVLIDIPVEESFHRRPLREDKYEANKDRLRRARINYLAYFESKGVDTSYWNTVMSGENTGEVPRLYRTSPSGYAIVNGMGTPEVVHARIKEALEL